MRINSIQAVVIIAVSLSAVAGMAIAAQDKYGGLPGQGAKLDH